MVACPAVGAGRRRQRVTLGPKRGVWTRLPQVEKNGSRGYAQRDIRVVITDDDSGGVLAGLPPTLSISLQHQPPHPPGPQRTEDEPRPSPDRSSHPRSEETGPPDGRRPDRRHTRSRIPNARPSLARAVGTVRPARGGQSPHSAHDRWVVLQTERSLLQLAALPNVSRFCCAASMLKPSASRKASAADPRTPSATAAIACGSSGFGVGWIG